MRISASMGVAMIEAYQRWLSPRKGFRCAYGALHGDGAGTCSSIGKRIMREQGVLKFLRLMPLQFAACKAAAASLSAETDAERRRREQEKEWKRDERRERIREACEDFDCDDLNCSACAVDIDFCQSCHSSD